MGEIRVLVKLIGNVDRELAMVEVRKTEYLGGPSDNISTCENNDVSN